VIDPVARRGDFASILTVESFVDARRSPLAAEPFSVSSAKVSAP